MGGVAEEIKPVQEPWRHEKVRTHIKDILKTVLKTRNIKDILKTGKKY